MLKGKRVRKSIRLLKKRPIRLDHGTDDELKALASSWLENPLHDIICRPDLTVADGNRRVLGLELLGVEEAEVFVTEENLTDDQLDEIGLISAYHRAPLGSYEQAHTAANIKAARPGTTNKSLAEKLHLDPSSIGRLLSLFDCVQQVQDAARAGKIGVKGWYPISLLPPNEQPALLAVKLGGGSAAEVERQSRKSRNGKAAAVRLSRVKIAMPRGATVIISGTDLSMSDVVELLTETLKEARKAADQFDVRTWQSMMRDKAKQPVP